MHPCLQQPGQSCTDPAGPKLPDQKDDEGASDEAIRYLARRKANYSAHDHLRMTWRDGALVPEDAPSHVGGLISALNERKAEEVALAAFRSLQAMGIRPTDGKSSPDYLPSQAVNKSLACGFSKAELGRAMDRLMTRGVMSRGVIGAYSNRNPKHGLILHEGDQ